MPTVNFLMLITFSKYDLMLADSLTTNLQWTMRHTNVFLANEAVCTDILNILLHSTTVYTIQQKNPQFMLHRKQQKYKIHRYKKYKVHRNKKKHQNP